MSAPGKDGPGLWRAALYVMFAPIVWAAHFGAVYAVQHTVCYATDAGGDVPAFVIAASLVALAPTLLMTAAPGLVRRLFGATGGGEDLSDLLIDVARLLAALSAAGIVLVGASAAIAPACAPMR